jgi:hypothetical protein
VTTEQRAAACPDTETAEDCGSMPIPVDVYDRVAGAIRAAVAEEREACARLAEAERSNWYADSDAATAARDIAKAIRGRT